MMPNFFHEIVKGLEAGANLLFTFRPNFDLGIKLARMEGFPNLVVLVILFIVGRLVYYKFRNNEFVRNMPFGDTGFIIFLVCLAIGLSSIATLCLIFFFIYGILVGFFIGLKNGKRLYQTPLYGVGVVFGIVIIANLSLIIPNEYAGYIQVLLVSVLTWDSIRESVLIVKPHEHKEFNIFLIVGGVISLSIFDPVSYNILMVEASKTTSLEVENGLPILLPFFYLPVMGWLMGYFNQVLKISKNL